MEGLHPFHKDLNSKYIKTAKLNDLYHISTQTDLDVSVATIYLQPCYSKFGSYLYYSNLTFMLSFLGLFSIFFVILISSESFFFLINLKSMTMDNQKGNSFERSIEPLILIAIADKI